MNKTVKIIIGIVLVGIVVLAITAISKNYTAVTVEAVKVGVLMPLSGNSAFLGEGAKNALKMAQFELSVKYPDLSFDFIYEDTQMSPAVTVSAANKLLFQDKVDIIISGTAGTGNMVSPLTEKAHVVHFGVANDPNIARGDYNFIHWTQPASLVSEFINELKRRNIHKISVLAMNVQGFIALSNELERQLAKETDVTVVAKEMFTSSMDIRDFRSGILRTKNSGAEIYLVGAFSPELEIIARQIRELLGSSTPLTSLVSFENTKETSLFNGLWYIGAAAPTNDFVEKYSRLYGMEPTIGTANGYDILYLIAEAIRIDNNKKNLAFTLPKISAFPGALGMLSFDSDGIVISKATVKMIKDGKPQVISN